MLQEICKHHIGSYKIFIRSLQETYKYFIESYKIFISVL